MILMGSLENVYCLGCKDRHPTVEVGRVLELSVKGSTRYQAQGICENGKKWTKLLNKAEREILADYITQEPSDDVKVVVQTDQTEIEPLVQEDEIVEPIVEEPIVEPSQGADIEVESVLENEIVVENEPVVEPILVEEVEAEVVTIPDIPKVNKPAILNTVMQPVDDVVEAVENEMVELHREVRQLRTPRKRPNPQDKQSEIRAMRVGRHLGYSSAVKVGPRYRNALRKHFDKSGLHMRYFDSFANEYMRAGEEYLHSVSENYVETREQEPTNTVSDNQDGLSTPAVAGLAAMSIFGAWVAAKFNNNR